MEQRIMELRWKYGNDAEALPALGQLAQAKELNPDCTFVQGDMRMCRLGRGFDAVLMDDAISHLNCRADFVAAFRTCVAKRSQQIRP